MNPMEASNAAAMESFQDALREARVKGYKAGYASWGVVAKGGNPFVNPYPNGEDNPLGSVWAEEFRLGRYERKMELSE